MIEKVVLECNNIAVPPPKDRDYFLMPMKVVDSPRRVAQGLTLFIHEYEEYGSLSSYSFGRDIIQMLRPDTPRFGRREEIIPCYVYDLEGKAVIEECNSLVPKKKVEFLEVAPGYFNDITLQKLLFGGRVIESGYEYDICRDFFNGKCYGFYHNTVSGWNHIISALRVFVDLYGEEKWEF